MASGKRRRRDLLSNAIARSAKMRQSVLLPLLQPLSDFQRRRREAEAQALAISDGTRYASRPVRLTPRTPASP
jgi:hypothetical protein